MDFTIILNPSVTMADLERLKISVAMRHREILAVKKQREQTTPSPACCSRVAFTMMI